MMKHARWIGTGVGVVALSICLLLTADRGEAANADELKAGLPKLADAMKKKDDAAVKKLVEALTKGDTDINEFMSLYNSRSDKKNPGLGVGPKPGAIVPDGIEAKIQSLANPKASLFPARLKGETEALIDMAYLSAAGAKLTQALADAHVPKDIGKRKKADWIKWSQDMETASLELIAVLEAQAKAAKPDTMKVKQAAFKLDNACITCHNVFKK
jgi:hypothetical protein